MSVQARFAPDCPFPHDPSAALLSPLSVLEVLLLFLAVFRGDRPRSYAPYVSGWFRYLGRNFPPTLPFSSPASTNIFISTVPRLRPAVCGLAYLPKNPISEFTVLPSPGREPIALPSPVIFCDPISAWALAHSRSF